MYKRCESLSVLPDLSKWNTKNISNMNKMFYRCKSLLSLSFLSKWENPEAFKAHELLYLNPSQKNNINDSISQIILNNSKSDMINEQTFESNFDLINGLSKENNNF